MARRKLFLLAGLVLALGAHAAGGVEATARIRQAAIDFVRQQSAATTQIQSADIDARLRLPACPNRLNASAANPPSRGAWTISVSCPGANGAPPRWSIYVPMRVADRRPVVVLTRPLGVGQPIPADALAVEDRDISTLAFGYLSDPSSLVGRILRRPLSAGSAVTPDAIGVQKVIRRGELVTLLGRAGGLEVRAQGKALADGGQGDRIAVENTSSRRVVNGVIRDDGVVEVSL